LVEGMVYSLLWQLAASVSRQVTLSHPFTALHCRSADLLMLSDDVSWSGYDC